GRSTDGIYTTTTEGDISSGVYTTLLLEGTTLPDKTQIKTTLNMRGTKIGQDPSQLSFNVDGVDNGEVRVIVLVNGAQALSKVVIIGNGIPVVSSTPSGSSPVVAAGTTIAADISGVATATSTTVPASSKTFYSADRTVSITAEGVDYIGLLSVDAKNIPAGWITLGDAYTIAPDNLALYPAGDLTITLPTQTNSGADYAYFIGQYQNGEWGVVPSSPANNAIKIKINKAGTYALMALKSESSVPATVSTTAATGSSAIQSPTASGSPTPKGTPKIASIALAETPVPALTKKAPLDILVVFGALGIFGAVLVIRKRK
ncbi:MAG: hypothetical protein NTZ39_01970, partial [Methanoregula sp.]|nr:hypothetical protein [Methanoregula sp.]